MRIASCVMRRALCVMRPHNAQRKAQNAKCGFTLIELIFVAVILLVITTLAVPQFRKSFDSIQLQNFVSDVVSFARYAQAKAITDGAKNRLVFDSEKKTVTIEVYAGVQTGVEGAKELWANVRYRKIPDFILVGLENNQKAVNFYPDGTADKAAIKISVAAGKSFTISIDPLTGYVKTEESSQ